MILYDILKKINTDDISGDWFSVLFARQFKKRLPAGYVELTYIESTGTQYVDTDITPTNKHTTYVRFSPTIGDAIETNGAIFGTRYGVSGVREYRVQISTSQAQTQRSIQRIFNNQVSGFTSNFYEWNKGQIYEIEFGAKTYINGSLTDEFTDSTYTAGQKLYLLAANLGGTISSYTKSRLYKCTIKESGNMVRDFYPCYRVSDGETGLYDAVSDSFFGNSGTGEFVRGEPK